MFKILSLYPLIYFHNKELIFISNNQFRYWLYFDFKLIDLMHR